MLFSAILCTTVKFDEKSVNDMSTQQDREKDLRCIIRVGIKMLNITDKGWVRTFDMDHHYQNSVNEGIVHLKKKSLRVAQGKQAKTNDNCIHL